MSMALICIVWLGERGLAPCVPLPPDNIVCQIPSLNKWSVIQYNVNTVCAYTKLEQCNYQTVYDYLHLFKLNTHCEVQ